jgi:hypothetical protein
LAGVDDQALSTAVISSRVTGISRYRKGVGQLDLPAVLEEGRKADHDDML